MSAQVTPRKRKVPASSPDATRSGAKGKQRGPPTPNPPLVPFPTPPRSRHRPSVPAATTDNPFLSLPSPPSTPSKRSASTAPLPPQLQTLLSLHHAFNLALSLHIATNPPILPPHPPNTKKLPVPSLMTYLSIKETVERSSGRRFGLAELGRLAWLWTWDGEELPEEKLVSERTKTSGQDDDNPFLVSPKPEGEKTEVLGLSYLITPTRTLDPSSGRRVHTYGFGIELDLKPGETRQVPRGRGVGSAGNKGQGGGAGALGRWSVAGAAREEVVRQRLERWVELNGGYEPPPDIGLPTPSTSSSSSRSSIPPIPLLPLPTLPAASLLPAVNLFASSSFGPGLSATPKKPSLTKTFSAAGLSDPFELTPKEKGKVVRPGSVEERKQAMIERMKARSGGSKQSLATLGSAVAGGIGLSMSAAETQEELKRRSTLSRLENVAEAVWMMFSAPTPGPSTLPTPPRGRRKAIPMSEAAEVIVKSSKTPISIAEAQTSLQLLTDLCPFFLTMKTVARQEWLEMPLAVALPPSPGSSSTARLGIPMSAPASPSAVRDEDNGKLRPGPRAAMPESPTRGGAMGGVLVGTAGRMPESPTRGGARGQALAGPASPGRVRKVQGLREVRERIRRELGE